VVEPDEEMYQILVYLSNLHEKKQLETYVTFGMSDASTRVEVKSINMMWKEGKRLLTTHADIIFCDSMWNVSFNGYYVLTIVVVDENADIRLAALSLASVERKDSWKAFFAWVNSVVPTFNPKCIVTDGAMYINSGFQLAVGDRARNIVCWWHQRENVYKKIGINHEIGKIFLQITYARNQKVIDALKEKARILAKNDDKIGSMDTFEKLLENCSKNALVSLDIFTAGTVTNSYSESINSILRRAGLRTNHSMLTILRYLDNLSSQYNNRPSYRFLPCDKLQPVISDDTFSTVTSGALCHFQKKIKGKIISCELTKQDGHQGVVKERRLIKQSMIIVRSKNGRRRFFYRRLKSRFMRFHIKSSFWRVNWSGNIPVCSCNAPVYGGMPRVHIVTYAIANGKKIPTGCFNPRFYYDSCNAAAVASIEQPRTNLLSLDDSTNKQMPLAMTDDEEENCEGVETYSVCKLELTNKDEILFYDKLFVLYLYLCDFCSKPELKKDANAVGTWLTQASDGLLLGCTSSLSNNDSSDNAECKKILDGISLISQADNSELKLICDELRMTDNCLNGTYPSEEMSCFRGGLKAVMIKLILVRRVCPSMVPGFVDQFKQKVGSLQKKTGATVNSIKAGLKKVDDCLNNESYKEVPKTVCEFCKTALFDSMKYGLSHLLNTINNSNASKPAGKNRSMRKARAGKNGNKSSSTGSKVKPARVIPLRIRRPNSMFAFLSK